MIGIVTLPHPLQVQAEALHHCVVPAVAFAAHAAHELMPSQQGLVPSTRVLTTSIRMHAQPRCRLALCNSQLQCQAHQGSGHLGRHGPAAHRLVGVQVQHHSQVQPATAGADVGDAGDPGLVVTTGIELPIQHVGRYRQTVLAAGGVHKLAPPQRAQLMLEHQAAHAIAANEHAT